ncbi:unnamed protein product [Rotaria magnacalcarata]|uniref:Peptidylamidoglycolate lyase n=1 Tax=Rotaria magnacalcarata TaxID=392030 RepID=A0A8S2TW08_9BILA|nr:unnamed protein product [Rotaria magnacalcarata]
MKSVSFASFPDGRNFDKTKFGVIPDNTILTVSTHTGQIIEQWGNNTFYMPHGLAVDSEENLWLTDVGVHQWATDVVAANDGSKIYVADGYCNARIVKFDSKGKFLKEYSMPEDEQPLLIPHSIVLIEALDRVCVADRENGRIVCFDDEINNDDGDDETNENNQSQVKAIIDHPLMRTVYAIHYDPIKLIYYEIINFTFNKYFSLNRSSLCS